MNIEGLYDLAKYGGTCEELSIIGIKVNLETAKKLNIDPKTMSDKCKEDGLIYNETFNEDDFLKDKNQYIKMFFMDNFSVHIDHYQKDGEISFVYKLN